MEVTPCGMTWGIYSAEVEEQEEEEEEREGGEEGRMGCLRHVIESPLWAWVRFLVIRRCSPDAYHKHKMEYCQTAWPTCRIRRKEVDKRKPVPLPEWPGLR